MKFVSAVLAVAFAADCKITAINNATIGLGDLDAACCAGYSSLIVAGLWGMGSGSLVTTCYPSAIGGACVNSTSMPDTASLQSAAALSCQNGAVCGSLAQANVKNVSLGSMNAAVGASANITAVCLPFNGPSAIPLPCSLNGASGSSIVQFGAQKQECCAHARNYALHSEHAAGASDFVTRFGNVAVPSASDFAAAKIALCNQASTSSCGASVHASLSNSTLAAVGGSYNANFTARWTNSSLAAECAAWHAATTTTTTTTAATTTAATTTAANTTTAATTTAANTTTAASNSTTTVAANSTTVASNSTTVASNSTTVSVTTTVAAEKSNVTTTSSASVVGLVSLVYFL